VTITRAGGYQARSGAWVDISDAVRQAVAGTAALVFASARNPGGGVALRGVGFFDRVVFAVLDRVQAFTPFLRPPPG
jgi:hypothetical protein